MKGSAQCHSAFVGFITQLVLYTSSPFPKIGDTGIHTHRETHTHTHTPHTQMRQGMVDLMKQLLNLTSGVLLLIWGKRTHFSLYYKNFQLISMVTNFLWNKVHLCKSLKSYQNSFRYFDAWYVCKMISLISIPVKKIKGKTIKIDNVK